MTVAPHFAVLSISYVHVRCHAIDQFDAVYFPLREHLIEARRESVCVGFSIIDTGDLAGLSLLILFNGDNNSRHVTAAEEQACRHFGCLCLFGFLGHSKKLLLSLLESDIVGLYLHWFRWIR